jgi:hypothetical protein
LFKQLKIWPISNIARPGGVFLSLIVLILQNYFQELSFLENKFVKFYKHKNNATLYIIFAAKAVKFLPGIATCGEGGFFLKA